MLTVREVSGGVTFAVRVQTGAKCDSVIGAYGEAVKITSTAPAEDGRANEAVVRFLAGFLEVPRTSIAIVSGERSRSKVIRIQGVSSSAIQAAFSPKPC